MRTFQSVILGFLVYALAAPAVWAVRCQRAHSVPSIWSGLAGANNAVIDVTKLGDIVISAEVGNEVVQASILTGQTHVIARFPQGSFQREIYGVVRTGEIIEQVGFSYQEQSSSVRQLKISSLYSLGSEQTLWSGEFERVLFNNQHVADEEVSTLLVEDFDFRVGVRTYDHFQFFPLGAGYRSSYWVTGLVSGPLPLAPLYSTELGRSRGPTTPFTNQEAYAVGRSGLQIGLIGAYGGFRSTPGLSGHSAFGRWLVDGGGGSIVLRNIDDPTITYTHALRRPNAYVTGSVAARNGDIYTTAIPQFHIIESRSTTSGNTPEHGLVDTAGGEVTIATRATDVSLARYANAAIVLYRSAGGDYRVRYCQ